jgi:protein-disulfide isomerase
VPFAHADDSVPKDSHVSRIPSVVGVKKDPEDAPVQGTRRPTVTIELFCTYVQAQCAHTHRRLSQLLARHPKRLRIIYRQLPLPYHKDSQTLAEAALEAWRQDRFLEFQEALYGEGGRVAKRDLERLARRASLDFAALERALAEERHRGILDRDALWAIRFGVERAPSLVWNGRVSTTTLARLEDYEEHYHEARTRALRLVRDGVPQHRLYARLLSDAEHQRVRPVRVAGASRLPGPLAPEATREIDVRAPRISVPIESSPIRGAQAAEVTLVVFGDFECRFCQSLQATLQKLDETYPRRLRVVYKHFPLSVHPNAQRAAEAAACAASEGKFWAYHDLLYKNLPRLSLADLVRYAGDVGLEPARFLADLDSHRCQARVDADILLGKTLGITATPTLIVNGLKLVGQRSFSELRLLVEHEIRPGMLEEVTAP